MDFKTKHNNFDINFKTYGSVGNSTKGIFKTTTYDDIGNIDYSQPLVAPQKLSFAVSSEYSTFELAKLPPQKTWIDFLNDVTTVGNAINQFFKTAVSTVANVAVGFAEGIVSFGEAVVDAAVMAGGAVCSVGTAIWDLGKGIFTGDWSFSTTESLWTKNVMPAVAVDYTDAAFDALYSTSFMKAVDDNAIGAAKRETGWMYAVSEGVGYYTGMLALATVTAGAGAAAAAPASIGGAATSAVSFGGTSLAQGLAVGVGQLGKQGQKNYAAAIENAQKEGRELTLEDAGKATLHAAGTAVVAGGVHFAAGHYGAVGSGKEAALLPGAKALASNTAKVVSTYVVPTAIKMTKPLLTETMSYAYTGEFDGKGVVIDTIATGIGETFAAGMGGKFAGKNWKLPGASNATKSAESAMAAGDAISIGSKINDSTSETAKSVISDASKSWENIKNGLVTIGKNKQSQKAVKEIVNEVADMSFSEGS